MKRIFVLCSLLSITLSLVACGDKNTLPPAFSGSVQSIDQINALDEVIGTRGYVVANRELLTDEYLVEFFHNYIRDSGHNYFTIAFGDGTGYLFPSSRDNFSHQQLDDDGAGISPVGMSGVILDDSIHWIE